MLVYKRKGYYVVLGGRTVIGSRRRKGRLGKSVGWAQWRRRRKAFSPACSICIELVQLCHFIVVAAVILENPFCEAEEGEEEEEEGDAWVSVESQDFSRN